MKTLLLDGSRQGQEELGSVRQVLVNELEGMGWTVDLVPLREIEIHDCLGCFDCWVKTPGICIIDDEGRDVTRALVQSDLVIFLTPVTFGGYSSELKKALDRSIGLLSPFFARIDGEVHHQPRYEHYPRLLGVGVLAEPDPESERIFKTLVKRNAINLYAPAHAAGVIVGEPGDAEISATVRALLTAVGVEE